MELSNKQRVLIVDDSPININALAELLKGEYEIKVANNGSGALKIAEGENPPDIILLDIMMPGMDGYEICKKLKRSKVTKDIPVIFITAMDSMESEEYGLGLGAIDYITKPFSPSIVKLRIKNHLELKRYRDILKELSMIDGLTGIPNRRRFDEALATEWSRALRYEKNLSLIMIDIDHFKYYNDTCGHLDGDECLRSVAQRLSNIPKRSTDMLARYGGEEFVCLLPDTELKQALEIAEKLRSGILALGIPHKTSLVSDSVTISLGVAALIPQRGQSPDILIKSADEALYAAKSGGRNRVACLL